MALPSALVPALRSALQSQGFPRSSVTDAGNIDPAALLSGVFHTIELRSAATPPITIKTAELQFGGPPNPWLSFLKPTVIMTGPAGRTLIAPYGEAGDGTLGAVVVVGGLVGLGVLLGKLMR